MSCVLCGGDVPLGKRKYCSAFCRDRQERYRCSKRSYKAREKYPKPTSPVSAVRRKELDKRARILVEWEKQFGFPYPKREIALAPETGTRTFKNDTGDAMHRPEA